MLFEGLYGSGTATDYSNPFNDIISNSYPSIISEVNWEAPNAYRADLPLTAAAYGSLQGTDGIFPFTASGITWEQQDGKFTVQVPVLWAQYPLAGFISATTSSLRPVKWFTY